MPLTLGILGSGAGTNLQAFLDATASGRLTGVRIGLVASDRPDAHLLDRAREAGIPARHIDPGPFKTKLDPEAEDRYVAALREHKVDLVVLAGFMRIVKDGLLAAFPDRIVNIHPSLLPAFPGLRAWQQAFDAGVKIAGCTVHLVDAGVDCGPIVAQAAVPVLHNDTPEALYARIQESEHRLYPEAVQAFVDGRVTLCDRRVTVLPVVSGTVTA